MYVSLRSLKQQDSTIIRHFLSMVRINEMKNLYFRIARNPVNEPPRNHTHTVLCIGNNNYLGICIMRARNRLIYHPMAGGRGRGNESLRGSQTVSLSCVSFHYNTILYYSLFILFFPFGPNLLVRRRVSPTKQLEGKPKTCLSSAAAQSLSARVCWCSLVVLIKRRRVRFCKRVRIPKNVGLSWPPLDRRLSSMRIVQRQKGQPMLKLINDYYYYYCCVLYAR